MQTRVYTDKIEIDNNSTKEFWENRANNINNLQTVLLGSDETGIEQNTRNEHEKLIVESVIKQIQNPRILDIGCGYGVIGIILSSFFHGNYDLVDVNKRAIHLAKMNVSKNKVVANVFIVIFILMFRKNTILLLLIHL